MQTWIRNFEFVPEVCVGYVRLVHEEKKEGEYMYICRFGGSFCWIGKRIKGGHRKMCFADDESCANLPSQCDLVCSLHL